MSAAQNAPGVDWGLAVALLLVLFTAGQVFVVSRQRSLTELQVVHELRDQWESVRDEWIGLLVMGGHFYLDIPPEVVAKYPALGDERLTEYREVVHFNKDADWDAAVHEFTRRELGERSPIRFDEEIFRGPLELLAAVCASLLRGRIAIATAYDVFGADLTRNSGTVRYVTDVHPDSTYYLLNYPGIRRRVLILLDLMWAEAARRGDLAEREAARAAEVKAESRSGVRNRRRARREARRMGSIISPVRLGWHLAWAEVAPELVGRRRWAARLRSLVRGFRRFEGELFPRRDPWSR